jgi:hypothetical protein
MRSTERDRIQWMSQIHKNTNTLWNIVFELINGIMFMYGGIILVLMLMQIVHNIQYFK